MHMRTRMERNGTGSRKQSTSERKREGEARRDERMSTELRLSRREVTSSGLETGDEEGPSAAAAVLRKRADVVYVERR